MKRILFSMIALLAFGGTAFADELTVEDVDLSYVSKNTTTALLINLNSDTKSSVESVVFTIKLPDGVEFVTKDTSDGLQAVSTFGPDYDGQILGNFLADGSYKVALASGTALRGKKGLLLAFSVKPTSTSLTEGQNLGDGTLKDITFTHNNGTESWKSYPSNSTFNVTATKKIVLDENSPLAVTSSDFPRNILVKRTLKAGIWNTICLPFTMTRTQLENAFGTDVKVAEFTGCDYNETNGISLKFTTTTGDIKYGIPYLINVSSGYSKFTVSQVTISSSLQEKPKQMFEYEEMGAMGSMTGHYSLKTMNKYDMFLQDNEFYYAVAGQTIKGFRATFNFIDEEGENILMPAKATSRGMFLVDGKPIDDVTGISSNRIISENKRVYSITGRFMGENVDMKSLPKGIYIVDGVKIIND